MIQSRNLTPNLSRHNAAGTDDRVVRDVRLISIR